MEVTAIKYSLMKSNSHDLETNQKYFTMSQTKKLSHLIDACGFFINSYVKLII
jgi:hypothetical protein